MKHATEIIYDYSAGKITLEEANAALKTINAGFFLDPQKNILTEEEKRATTIGYYPEQANGYGLLDTGTGSYDKVLVQSGKLVNCDCGIMDALVIMVGRTYRVQGTVLVD